MPPAVPAVRSLTVLFTIVVAEWRDYHETESGSDGNLMLMMMGVRKE